MTAVGRERAGGGIKHKGKRTHGHGQQCGDCGVLVGRAVVKGVKW